MTVRLTPTEFALTCDKVAKINERAAKRGFTGRVVITGERLVVTSTDALGFEVTEVFIDAEISGDAPSYNGWTFLARVDALGDSFTLATAPGVEYVDRSQVRPGHCDHCAASRARRNTYLVRNDETGEIKNVGSTCIKDFLGWTGSFVFISEDEVTTQAEGFAGSGERTFSVDTVLAYAYAATRAFGFVSTTAYDGSSTRNRVALGLGLYRPNKKEEADLALLREYAAEAGEKAKTIRDFIASDAFDGQSTYVGNLKACVAADAITIRQFGILVSAPQAYTRFLETEAERTAREARWAAEKAATTASDYIAEVGTKKVRVEGTISAIRYIDGDYGTTVLYTITTPEGNLVKWFASREALGEKEGVEVAIEGTVKAHDEYKGTKSTVLTRCKAVA